MSKDTNSFGHDKALACESRGFVYKKRGCIVLTHPLHWDLLWNTDFADFTDLFCSYLGSVAAYVVPRSARLGLNINYH